MDVSMSNYGGSMQAVEPTGMSMRRPACDTYFVEDTDHSLFEQRAAERERARILNKRVQRDLAEHLSNVTADEYEEDILAYMERIEVETMPDVNSIDIQTEIQWFMRPYLLDFLIEVHGAFTLLPETLSLAINLLDRYCSKRVVYKKHYQLVGCTALLIAAKYGDRKERVPTVQELKSMCCSLYEADMFTQMEWHVLQTLGWAIGHPTVPSFLQIILTESSEDSLLEHMTWYISEVALYHREFVSVQPSVLARSVVALARLILQCDDHQFSDWARQYDHQTVLCLHRKLAAPSEVVSRKYAIASYSRVSDIVASYLNQCYDNSTLRVPGNGYTSWHVPTTPSKSGYVTSHLPEDLITPPITPDKGPYAFSNEQNVPSPLGTHQFAPPRGHPGLGPVSQPGSISYFPTVSPEV